jgi:hypothetical protein
MIDAFAVGMCGIVDGLRGRFRQRHLSDSRCVLAFPTVFNPRVR